MFRSLSGTLSDLASSASASLGFDSSSDDEDAFVARLEARSREERDGLDADGLDVYRALESLLRASRSAADAAAPRAVDPGLLRRVVATVTEDEGRRASVEHRAAVALKRVNKLLAWRESVRADSVLDEALPNAEHFHACWPVAVHPPDAFGHPVVAERISDIDPAGLTERVGDQATVLRHRVQIMEAVQRLKALESRRRTTSSSHNVWIIDLEGVTVSLFAGDVRAFILDLVKLCTSKYTDTLHAMWILNTPYVFRAVWGRRRDGAPKQHEGKDQDARTERARDQKRGGGAGGARRRSRRRGDAEDRNRPGRHARVLPGPRRERGGRARARARGASEGRASRRGGEMKTDHYT